jgi:hypothetical protein
MHAPAMVLMHAPAMVLMLVPAMVLWFQSKVEPRANYIIGVG